MAILVEKKPMIYGGGCKSDVLYHEQNDDGTGIIVLNILGSHPCGYITFNGIDKVPDYDSLWLKNASVHGGFTFLGQLHKPGENSESFFDGQWIGWDYAHVGDYTYVQGGHCFFDNGYERKYTTGQIISEARLMLDDIRNGNFEILDSLEEDDDYEGTTYVVLAEED